MNNVLLVDDDEKLSQSLVEYFNQFGLSLAVLHDGRVVTEKLAEVELVILDVMLPGEDGFSICKRLREISDIPIVMLTARGEVTDKVVGFELGANDYLAKPFEPRELVARVQSLLRRKDNIKNQPEQRSPDTYQFQALTIDWIQHRVFVEDQETSLTAMEFELLKLLVAKKQVILSRDDILNHLKGIDTELFTRSVDILVSRLRGKLQDNKEQVKYIKTIWGRGYCFIGK